MKQTQKPAQSTQPKSNNTPGVTQAQLKAKGRNLAKIAAQKGS